MKKVYELDFHGKKIIVENGEVAKQATGSVIVRYGDTVVLAAAVVNKNVNLLSDFFPLTVIIKKNYILLVKYQEDLSKEKDDQRMQRLLLHV